MEKQEIDQKIQDIANEIADKYKPEKIILFGSFAWGNPTADSDVDLLIIKHTKKNKFERAKDIRSEISIAEFPMDILVYTPEEVERSVNDYKNLFIEDILRNGKILYSNSKNAFSITLPARQLNILHKL